MPRDRPGRWRGLCRAVQVLSLGTTLAVVVSSSTGTGGEHSAFIAGPKKIVANPPRLGGNGRAHADWSSPQFLPASVDTSAKQGSSVLPREFGTGGGWSLGRAQAHVSCHQRTPKRPSAVCPLSGTSVLLHDEPVYFGGRETTMSQVARWMITRCILARARASAGLKVQVEAGSNRDAMRGRFDSVTVECDELMFDNVQVSGGAKFEVLGLDLLSAGLLPGPMKRLRRLRRPCEVSCVAEFTDADLMYSPAFRRLAECIVNAALRPKKDRDTGAGRDVPTALGYRVDEQRVHVFRVRTRGSKLVVEGEMESGPLFRVPFRYDCSLSVSHDGHILNVKESTVYWGTPSGHMPLPMLPLQSVTVDLGDRARIEHFKIAKGRVTLSGRFILSPITPLMVSRVTKRARIEHDLAESLSRLVFKIFRIRRE